MEEIAKKHIYEYNELMRDIDTLPVADALEKLKLAAENLAESLTDIIYWE